VHSPQLPWPHNTSHCCGRAARPAMGKFSVVKGLDEHERTMAFAEVALGQIRSLRQTATPRNYEIWNIYATGYNAPRNKIINETLAGHGKLTEADLEQIYETYLSHLKTTNRIDKVGARVIGEIDDVMRLIADALGMSTSYDASLSGASEKLRTARSAEQVKTIVESLLRSTHEMRETNKALEQRLSLSKNEISNLQQSLEAIRAESLTDPLTGLGNRKYFDRMIETAVQNALTNGEPLSLLMFDIDHFKSFNDSYGHLTGDQVLRLVGMSLKQTIKGQDITARYGGQEFAFGRPTTGLRQALTVADHIRRAVMAKELKKKSTGEILGRVTISVGVSMLKPGDDTDSLIERADACLYAAKRNGRNRVICEADPEYSVERRGQVACATFTILIPGRGEAASPESITTIVSMDSGLAPSGAPRNDGVERATPSASRACELLPSWSPSSPAPSSQAWPPLSSPPSSPWASSSPWRAGRRRARPSPTRQAPRNRRTGARAIASRNSP